MYHPSLFRDLVISYMYMHVCLICCSLYTVGGSSGTAMYIAMKAAADFGMKKGQRVVVICPDSIRNYM